MLNLGAFGGMMEMHILMVRGTMQAKWSVRCEWFLEIQLEFSWIWEARVSLWSMCWTDDPLEHVKELRRSILKQRHCIRASASVRIIQVALCRWPIWVNLQMTSSHGYPIATPRISIPSRESWLQTPLQKQLQVLRLKDQELEVPGVAVRSFCWRNWPHTLHSHAVQWNCVDGSRGKNIEKGWILLPMSQLVSCISLDFSPGVLQPGEGDAKISPPLLLVVLVPCGAFGAEEVQDVGLEHRLRLQWLGLRHLNPGLRGLGRWRLSRSLKERSTIWRIFVSKVYQVEHWTCRNEHVQFPFHHKVFVWG